MTGLDVDLSRLAAYDYVLPDDLVARYPLEARDASRMLCMGRMSGGLDDRQFAELPNMLAPGDLLVLNNAKVMPARLLGRKAGHTGQVELFLLRPVAPHEATDQARHWHVLMRPARRLHEGSQVVFDGSALVATITKKAEQGQGEVLFEWPGEGTSEDTSLMQQVEAVGQLPIPPYFNRSPEAIDTERYQTVFASVDGAQAAPTAGLHFTDAIFSQLRDRGVQTAEVTLMVGAGTFRPVLEDDVRRHRMDPEYYGLDQTVVDRIAQTKAAGGRVIAVGTTVLKTLESSAFYNQGCLTAEGRWSDLFIRPPFDFHVVDGLLTNFHLPRSTLLMLVSAFASRDHILQAYAHAVQQRYRFYSYGDCMIIV
ncbi:MAG: tRNA preQ1(34) S-adenosylmethionine ribosyltransferase-isomerase QueA [Cyanobacteria bacterium HKST-UBA03]|nr:tRNA preQ1(34) S-adenosylmethionine ribosyltransferase-isomerase QueA [Cyanobacteria bacterium HKST-UBA03]